MQEQVVKLRLDTRGFDRGISRATAALGALASVATVKTVADLADRFQQVNARLRLVTGSSQNFASAQSALNRVASETRGSLEETIDLYSRLARSTQGTAVSEGELLTATTTINQALKISGAGAQEANAAIIQLGQGLASGALRGDELRSVLEQTPRLAQTIADGLGVTIGELRELGTQGALTTEVVLKAIQNQAPLIAEEFRKIPPTISDAFTQLNNEVLKSTEVLNQAGFGAALSGIAQGIGDSLNAIGEAFKEILPDKDLKAFQKRVRLAFLDIVITVVGTIERFEPAISGLFRIVRDGINNLIRFANQLPPEAQLLGLIGYFLVGRGIRFILLGIAAFFDEIKAFVDRVIVFFEDKINSLIDVYIRFATYFGREPLDKVVFGDGAFSSMVDEINKKFVDFANTAVKKIREVGNETSKTNEKAKLFSDTLKEQKFLAEQIQFMDPTEFSMFTPKQAAPVSVPESSKAIQKRQQELNKRLAQLQKGLRNEEQAEMESFKDKLAILDEYYKDRQAFDQDYMRTREQLETQHSQKMAAIQSRNYDSQLGLLKSGKFAEMDLTKVAEDQKLKFVMDAGGAMINELGKHNKEAFYLAKA